MGTRNITRVILGETVIVNQYCQWDGYPTGQGQTVMEFVKKYCGGDELNEFKKRLDKSCLMLAKAGRFCYTGAPITKALDKLETLKYKSGDYSRNWLWKCLEAGMVTKQEVKEYMTASRDTGPEILNYLMDNEPDGMPFFTDEYCYKIGFELDWQIEGLFIIDLDKETVQIDWHGKVRTYPFSAVRGMTQEEIEAEMKSFEKSEDEDGLEH